jgi:starvation-inducible DNA-binding protein
MLPRTTTERSDMTPTSSPTNVPAIGAHERDEVGSQLQATLVDLVDLALLGKQLHWSVVGRDFRSLHLHLDELVDSWRDLGDTIAERAVAIGSYPDGQAGAVAAAGQVEPVERGPIEDADLVRLLTHRLGEAAERARERMDRLGELDAASQDAVIEVVRALEEQLWMVRAQLPAGG